MASSKSYVVTAPLVVAKDSEGHDRYLYRGASVPSDIDAEHHKMLVEEGLIVEAPEEPTEDGVPAKSASKGTWMAYATDEARGDEQLTEDEANAFTRDQLAERFGRG